jgi:tRNA modification GTPase
MKLHDLEDTIAAIATARGEGGIGIVRVSGPDSLKTALKIFQPKKTQKNLESHRLYYGDIVDPSDNRAVDEALLSYMKAPNSFTKEDVVEINSHGGSIVLHKIMEMLLREGIREASPGEFTKRAYLNGRIDLSQAEAVIDVIRARTEGGLRLANRQLKGGLTDALRKIREDLVSVLAVVEAYIDFPEEDIELQSLEEIGDRLGSSRKILQEIVDTYEEGRVYRDGIHVVIAGRPNVGKSSLLNGLLKEKRAIVTSIPGTTRDVIEEIINIKGIPVNLIDTAGIREAGDVIEGEGIRRTRAKLEEADVILYLVDEAGLNESDRGIIEEKREKLILVVNKEDLVGRKTTAAIGESAGGVPFVSISAESGSGIEELKGSVFERVVRHGVEAGADLVLSRKRHKVAMEKAVESIERGMNGVAEGISCEFISADLRDALNCIGEVAGETTTEDILDKIFSEFCIGK